MKIIEAIGNILGLKLSDYLHQNTHHLPDNIRPWTSLFCHIAAVDNWQFLLPIHYGLLFLVHEGVDRIQLPPALKTATTHEVNKVFEYLSKEYLRLTHKRSNGTWPKPKSFKTKLPIYAFLLSGFKADKMTLLIGENFNNLSATFRSIAWDVVTGLIAIQRDPSVKPTTISGLSLSARTLITQQPNIEAPDLKTIIENEDQAKCAFLDRHSSLAVKRDYNLNYTPERIEYLQYMFVYRKLRNLVELYNKQSSSRRQTKLLLSRYQKSWQMRNEDGKSNQFKPLSRPLLTNIYSQSNIKDGVAPSELEEELFENIEPNGYAHKYAISALLYQYEEATAWSNKVPGYNLLSQCYKSAFKYNWDVMTSLQRLAAFKIMVYLHHGILPDILNSIRVGTQRTGKRILRRDGIYLDVEKYCFTSLLPLQIEPETLLASLKWEERGLVEIPLPPLLRQMLKDLFKDFPVDNLGAQWIPDEIKVPNILPDRVSPNKLVNACERYYVKRYGLEPELLSLISGRPVLRRASSIHYFRTNYQRLRYNYHTAFSKFHGDILNACGNWDIEHRLPNIQSDQTQQTLGEIGSAAYPKLSDLFQYLENLRARLRQIEQAPFPEFRQWREVLILYVWEILKIATGMRAMRHPRFNRYSIIPNRPLRLRDKGSGWRLVPMHGLVVKLVRMLADANQRLWTSRKGKLPCPKKEEIFFVVAGGVKRPLAHSTVVSTAGKHGITYPTFKPNYQRHLMRSWLHEMGVSHRIADAVLGHKQGGPDALDNLSLIPIVQIQQCFLPAVDALFTRLGIIMVPEWSR